MTDNTLAGAEVPSVVPSLVGRALRAVTIANELISAQILVDQGADIHTLIFKPLGIDVLWKPKRTPREPGVGPPLAGDSFVLWNEYFRGGWNLIFPNFGPAVTHRGSPLEFHGEAARVAWSLGRMESSAAGASVELEIALLRSPFHIKRLIWLKAGEPVLYVNETITNQSQEPMECMWAHHPAFGAPLVSSDCTIETGAQLIESDDGYSAAGNDLPTGQIWPWPHVTNKFGEDVDLSKIPPHKARHSRVLYLKNFAQPRYRLVNLAIGLGIEMSWDAAVFPYATFWQDSGGGTGYPLFGEAYVMAIEPTSSYPAQGLPTVMEKTQTHMTFAPGEAKTTEVRARFFQP
jgi:galactose mutarotase-like enzyme